VYMMTIADTTTGDAVVHETPYIKEILPARHRFLPLYSSQRVTWSSCNIEPPLLSIDIGSNHGIPARCGLLIST
jgi:hypothetical protein